MKLEDDFHKTIPLVLKNIKDSQLAEKEVNGVIEYYPTGSPFDFEKPVQKMTDDNFRVSYLLQKKIILAFQEVGLIKNARYFGYMKGFNFKFELVNPQFNNFCKLFNKGKVHFENKNKKYILQGQRIKSKSSDNDNQNEDEEITDKAGFYACTNNRKVFYNDIEFNAREKLREKLIFLIQSHPTGLTAEQIIKKLSQKIKLQSFKQDIAEINSLSTRQFDKAFVNHQRGENNPYSLNI